MVTAMTEGTSNCTSNDTNDGNGCSWQQVAVNRGNIFGSVGNGSSGGGRLSEVKVIVNQGWEVCGLVAHSYISCYEYCSVV